METKPVRSVACEERRGVEISGDYEGFSFYHPVFTRRRGLILRDWRALEQTELIGTVEVYTGALVYTQTIDQPRDNRARAGGSPRWKMGSFCEKWTFCELFFFFYQLVKEINFTVQLILFNVFLLLFRQLFVRPEVRGQRSEDRGQRPDICPVATGISLIDNNGS